jgi:hypothetical protein
VLSAHQSPVGAAWYCGRYRQRPAEFGEQAVGLAVVADGAGRDAVLPGVLAAAAARDDVVDGLRLAAAVGAQVVVPAHQRTPGQRHPAAVRNAHIPAQPDHRRRDDDHRGGAQQGTLRIVMHDFGLLAQHQAHGTMQANRGQRLIRHVEQQHPSHTRLLPDAVGEHRVPGKHRVPWPRTA